MPFSRRRFLTLGTAGAVTLATRPSVAARRVAGGWQAAAPLSWSTREMCCTTWNEQIVVAGRQASAALSGTLYVFGGEYFSDDGGVYEHTWAYDSDPDTRAKRPPMRPPGMASPGLLRAGASMPSAATPLPTSAPRPCPSSKRTPPPKTDRSKRMPHPASHDSPLMTHQLITHQLMTRRLVVPSPTKPGTPH